MPSADDQAPPALYHHCVDVYNAMFESAQQKQLDDGTYAVTWEGMLTALITEQLRLSVPYYTQITQALRRMKCIRQIRRGGGTSPSVWELLSDEEGNLRRPTEELFANAKTPASGRTKGQKELDAVKQQNKDLAARVTTLEDRVSALEGV
jgi:hypothetical protein